MRGKHIKMPVLCIILLLSLVMSVGCQRVSATNIPDSPANPTATLAGQTDSSLNPGNPSPTNQPDITNLTTSTSSIRSTGNFNDARLPALTDLPNPPTQDIPTDIRPCELIYPQGVDLSWVPASGLEAPADYTGPTAYLTFDDGPSLSRTPEIIAILKAYQIHATFFMIGDRIKPSLYPVVLRNYLEGNALGNHTYDHLEAGKNGAHFKQSVAQTSELIQHITGARPILFRFPGGSNSHYNAGAIKDGCLAWLRQSHYKFFDWNCSVGDGTAEIYYTAQELSDNVFRSYIFGNGATPGHVVMLSHDSNVKEGAPHHDIIGALPLIIREFAKRGYKFAVLSQNGYTIHFVK